MLRRPPVVAALLAPLAAAYDLTPRWGHAVAYLPEPPTLVIQGGKTDPSGAYTYTSAPNSNETIIIPLGESFATSSPPKAELLNANPPGPDYAWHCMRSLGSHDGTWHLMTIGGDGGWAQRADRQADSVWLADLNPTTGTVNYTHEPTGWAGQPSRRVYHACAAPLYGGDIFVSGGINDDGSGTTYTTTCKFNTSTDKFDSLPDMPLGLYHHSSVLLDNGTLINFGGVYLSSDTKTPELEPLDRVFALDTSSPSATWNTLAVNGATPLPRRGCSATLNPDGTIFIFGGADVNFSTVYSDGWILDPKNLSWTQVIWPDGSGPGPRFDHTAIDVGGGQIIVFGGFGPYVAADTNIHVVGVTSTTATAAATYTPVPYTNNGGSNSNGGSSNGNGGSNSNGGNNPNGSNDADGSNTNGAPNRASGVTGVGPHESGGGGVGPGSPGPTWTNSTNKEGSHSGLTSARLAGLIVGLGAAVLIGVILFLWARHRYKRKHADGRGDNRVYTEKGFEGGTGLLDPEQAYSPTFPTAPGNAGLGLGLPEGGPPGRGKEALAALGVGVAAVGAAAVATARKISGRGEQEYTQLATAPPQEKDSSDEGDVGGGVFGAIRRSTRRIGRGIRLIGATRSIDDEDDDLPALQRTVKGKRSRKAMLQDEDTRRFSDARNPFNTIPEEGGSFWKNGDWVLDSPDRSEWREAKSLLSADGHLSPPPPVIPGGPVPTPAESLRGCPPSTPDPSIFEALQIINPPTPSVFEAFERSQAVPAATVGLGLGIATTGIMSNPFFNNSQNSLTPEDAISSRHCGGAAYSASDDSTSAPASTSLIRLPPINTVDEIMLHTNRYSTNSIPLSSPSSTSQAHSLADVGEATIGNVQHVPQASATASLLSRNASLRTSSPESPRSMRPLQNPVLRQVSLLRRISSGIMHRTRGEPAGLSALSRGEPSGLAAFSRTAIDVRDPAPQPSDWPLSQTQQSVMSHESTWPEDLYPAPLAAQRPSITEVGSIRSMGDMHVIQRELSLSSDEARIERLDTPDYVGTEPSSAEHVTPVSTGDRSAVGIQHPTVILRPTNPGPTPSGSTVATVASPAHSPPASPPLSPPLPSTSPPLSPLRSMSPPLSPSALLPPLLLGHNRTRSVPSSPAPGVTSLPRRASGDAGGFLTPLAITPSRSSEHSTQSHGSGRTAPSPTLPWGAQASPRNSPRHSPRPLPGGPRPPLTIATSSAVPVCPSPLSPTREAPREEAGGSGPVSRSGTASGSGSSGVSTVQTAVQAVTATASEVSITPSATTSTTSTTRAVLSPAPVGRYTPLLTPSPQRSTPTRRPVHDIVASINRRGGGLPSHFGAKDRSTSGSPVSISSPTRTYEFARRDPLTVANPDIREHSAEDDA